MLPTLPVSDGVMMERGALHGHRAWHLIQGTRLPWYLKDVGFELCVNFFSATILEWKNFCFFTLLFSTPVSSRGWERILYFKMNKIIFIS